MEIFETDNYLILDEEDYNESREDFLNRIYFIIKNFNKNDFKKLKNISYIFLNKNYKGNVYNNLTNKKLENYINKII